MVLLCYSLFFVEALIATLSAKVVVVALVVRLALTTAANMDASQHPLLHVMTAHKPPSSTDTARTLRVLRQHITQCKGWEFLRIWEFQAATKLPREASRGESLLTWKDQTGTFKCNLDDPC